ncbi:hypothetical protein BDP27DRAFT_251224 [Rhodocollybia butyracea]|uniref:Uncharacterized protein n=1 Tax=Rhodocollybia butyracea TaxID=206335 RepID=A0A9P5PCQ6_9AGAR|nr:hypothetical protein BDP27DRAFT_251224 [Rhodocollybia butyracea]
MYVHAPLYALFCTHFPISPFLALQSMMTMWSMVLVHIPDFLYILFGCCILHVVDYTCIATCFDNDNKQLIVLHILYNLWPG